MNLISFFTKMMHYLPSEFSHHLALKGLKFLYFTGFLKLFTQKKDSNLKFKNRDITHLNAKIGIAAGLDKNGDYIDCLAALGVDFIEVGTITPRPQKGNPKPRIFKNLKDILFFQPGIIIGFPCNVFLTAFLATLWASVTETRAINPPFWI